MKIQVLNRLNEKQQKKVQILLDACKDYEPITLTPPLKAEDCFDMNLPCFYLLYENNELVSFLSLFLPDQFYGEAMGFTHPMARQRGYFKHLWNEVLTRLEDYIEDMELLFVTDGNSSDALAALTAMEGEYQYSEYILEKDMNTDTDTSQETNATGNQISLTIHPVQPSDRTMAQCADIHEAIFFDGCSASLSLIKEMFSNPLTSTWLAYYEGQPAGIFHLTERESDTWLTGFGILPKLQGQGLGTALLHAIPPCLPPGHTLLSLQVGNLNETAFRLYKKEGFHEVSHRDYYY